jgi:hypothetical protein
MRRVAILKGLLLVGAALYVGGCTSTLKSLAGVWHEPKLALASSDDPRGNELMAEHETQIVAYLNAVSTGNPPPIEVLENKLLEGASRFVTVQGSHYLEIVIDRHVTYITGQVAGLVDTPRQRAESDFQDCVLVMLKEYPNGLMDADYTGLIVATTHQHADSKNGTRSPEAIRFVVPHDLLRLFRNLEITPDEFLQQMTITADGIRV